VNAVVLGLRTGLARNGSPHARDPSSATTVFFGSSHVDRLNDHVNRATGATAGHLIRQQLITEAKRLLVFTTQRIQDNRAGAFFLRRGDRESRAA
jgi:hypothetical protein